MRAGGLVKVELWVPAEYKTYLKDIEKTLRKSDEN